MNLSEVYHVNNIVDWVDRFPHKVIEDINSALNDPAWRVHGIETDYHVGRVSHELAYWARLNSFLTGLWGRLKHDTERTQKSRMALRDFLADAAQAARLNYEATSRVLTSHELIRKDTAMERAR